MNLQTITHTGRRVSYYTLVQIELVPTDYMVSKQARVVDETGLWEAVVRVDERLAARLSNEEPTYFWARIRGGEIDLHDRELNPEWEPVTP